jgi:hypothetical protein
VIGDFNSKLGQDNTNRYRQPTFWRFLVLVGYPNNQPMPNQPMLEKTIDPTEPKTKKTEKMVF